jgi:hypothetical protein
MNEALPQKLPDTACNTENIGDTVNIRSINSFIKNALRIHPEIEVIPAVTPELPGSGLEQLAS